MKSKAIRIPSWLYFLLLTAVFFGSCVLFLIPVWNLCERFAVHQITEPEKKNFPVLARSPDGKYVACRLSELPTGVLPVTSISREKEQEINRNLCDSIGWNGYHRYFQVLTEENGLIQVSLEVPTLHDSKTVGWYAIQQGSIIPQRIVSYGPGFAFIAMFWTFIASLFGIAILRVFIRPK